MILNYSLNTLPEILKNKEVFYLFDENTQHFCASLLPEIPDYSKCIVIPFGEANKTLKTFEYVCEQLLAKRATKSSVLVNVGGGVVTDIGGFVAATFKRGIEYINIPTSLLAMADASIGGKTGVDLNHIKNTLGVIYSPSHVITDPVFLKTLPVRHLYNGWAEIIKHSAIKGTGYLQGLPAVPPGLNEQNTWAGILEETIMAKAAIVEKDPLEKDLRRILNFGHTVGHAIESYALENNVDLLHGEAVAAGMIIETHAAVLQGITDISFLDMLEQKTRQVFPKINLQLNASQLLPYMVQDKKNKNHEISFALLANAGEPMINTSLEYQYLEEAVKHYFN